MTEVFGTASSCSRNAGAGRVPGVGGRSGEQAGLSGDSSALWLTA